MEAFNSVKECVKCGQERFAGDSDCNGNSYAQQSLKDGEVIPEHMVIKCHNCGYDWDEYCKDACDL